MRCSSNPEAVKAASEDRPALPSARRKETKTCPELGGSLEQKDDAGLRARCADRGRCRHPRQGEGARSGQGRHPENSVFVLSWLGGKDAGVFEKHGIDLEVDVRPFAGFLAGLPSKQCMATTYSGIDAIEKINEGVDWAIIGGGLTVMQDVIVRNDSLFQEVADLRGQEIRHLLDRRRFVQGSAGGDDRRFQARHREGCRSCSRSPAPALTKLLSAATSMR